MPGAMGLVAKIVGTNYPPTLANAFLHNQITTSGRPPQGISNVETDRRFIACSEAFCQRPLLRLHQGSAATTPECIIHATARIPARAFASTCGETLSRISSKKYLTQHRTRDRIRICIIAHPNHPPIPSFFCVSLIWALLTPAFSITADLYVID